MEKYILHWEKKHKMSEDSPLKASSSHTIFSLRSPQGPGVAVVNTHGARGVEGFGGWGCRGSVNHVSMAGRLGGWVGG